MAVRLTQAERTHRTRTLLRESAERAFAQKGIAATAVEEIARGAGYSKGAFYGNYAGKHELLMDLLEELQLGSVRYWRMVMDSASDPAADLRALTALYDDVPHTAQRALLSAELQLEADRNPQFRATFAAYLDELNGEIRAAIGAILARHGKGVPDNIDSVVVTTRLLGLGLASPSALGGEIAERTTPGAIMHGFFMGVIAAAPDLATERALET